MDKLSFQNPLFTTYAIAATLLILKAISMTWLTVVRMVKANGGYRSPEDANKTIMNKDADPSQLDRVERVERIRRIHQNDVENFPFFLVAGFLYILTDPPLLLAQVLLYGYVASRLLHFVVYLNARSHEARALCFTLGSFMLIFMTGRTLMVGLGW